MSVQQSTELLEELEVKLSILRQLLEDGENSGKSNYSLESFISEIDEEKI